MRREERKNREGEGVRVGEANADADWVCPVTVWGSRTRDASTRNTDSSLKQSRWGANLRKKYPNGMPNRYDAAIRAPIMTDASKLPRTFLKLCDASMACSPRKSRYRVIALSISPATLRTASRP